MGLLGLCRLVSLAFICFQVDSVTKLIQCGVQRLSDKSFSHLHELDLMYHRQGSKNTVFSINRAIRSIEIGLRFYLGFFAQMAAEFTILMFTLGFQCGPKYMINMLATTALYTWYTKRASKVRT